MKKAVVLALVGLFTLSACGQRTAPASAAPEAKTNAGSTMNESTTERPVGQADAESPQTQTNAGRPDAPKDLKPGTDGNTNPPPR